MVQTLINGFWELFKNITILNVIDILIVSYIFYRLFMLIRETRAETLMKGIVIVLVILGISNIVGFITLSWLIETTIQVGFIALIIIFQPELRRALEHLGRSKFFAKHLTISNQEMDSITSHIVNAAVNLSSQKVGALMVIEQETGLNDYIETGVKLDAIVTSQLLENIFVVNTPLHDGAVIIRNLRIAAAACFLPLTENYAGNKKLGTRHRAAIGISENSDALVIIVSEETGNISLAISGKLTRNYNSERLKDILIRIMQHRQANQKTLWKRVNEWIRQRQKI